MSQHYTWCGIFYFIWHETGSCSLSFFAIELEFCVKCALRGVSRRTARHVHDIMSSGRWILTYYIQAWSSTFKRERVVVEHLPNLFENLHFEKCLKVYRSDREIFRAKNVEYRRIDFDFILPYRIVHGFRILVLFYLDPCEKYLTSLPS